MDDNDSYENVMKRLDGIHNIAGHGKMVIVGTLLIAILRDGRRNWNVAIRRMRDK